MMDYLTTGKIIPGDHGLVASDAMRELLARVREEYDVVIVDTGEQLFEPRSPALDALVLTAERGSAFTLLHPQYSVVVPKPRPLKVPLAYVVAGEDQPLASVVNTWIELKRKDGTIDELFAHWILGRSASAPERRWSVLDDVLHWGTRPPRGR